jgi:putative transposase
MEAYNVKRLKELEEENQRLQQMYAELSLRRKLLKDVIEKDCKTSYSTKTSRLPKSGAWY